MALQTGQGAPYLAPITTGIVEFRMYSREVNFIYDTGGMCVVRDDCDTVYTLTESRTDKQGWCVAKFVAIDGLGFVPDFELVIKGFGLTNCFAKVPMKVCLRANRAATDYWNRTGKSIPAIKVGSLKTI